MYAFAHALQPLGPGRVIFDFPVVEPDEHQWHTIGMGPDERLYFGLGSTCNTCPCQTFGNLSRCTINRIRLDGSGVETLATGAFG